MVENFDPRATETEVDERTTQAQKLLDRLPTLLRIEAKMIELLGHNNADDPIAKLIAAGERELAELLTGDSTHAPITGLDFGFHTQHASPKRDKQSTRKNKRDSNVKPEKKITKKRVARTKPK